MRATKRVTAVILSIVMAFAFVPAAAFATSSASADQAAQGESAQQGQVVQADQAAQTEQAAPEEGALTIQQRECADGHHDWEGSFIDASRWEGICRACGKEATNCVRIPFKGTVSAGGLKRLAENMLSTVCDENGLVNGIEPVIILEMEGPAELTIDTDFTVFDIEQSVHEFSLTVKGDDTHTLTVTSAGINVGGDLLVESGNVKATTLDNGAAINVGGNITLAGGTVVAEGGLEGIYAAGNITVKDPARVTALADLTLERSAGLYSKQTFTMEGGNVIKAQGAYGIYASDGIVIKAGYVQAIASNAANPAIFSCSSITVSKPAVVKQPTSGRSIESSSNWSGSSGMMQATSGFAIGDDVSTASFVEIADGVLRDVNYYEHFYDPPAPEPEPAPTDGTSGSGGTSGTSGTETGASEEDTDGPTIITGDPTKAETYINANGESDSTGATFYKMKVRATTTKKSSIKLKWSAVKGATQYLVLGTKCGKKNKYEIIETVSARSYTNFELKKGTYYRYIVVAMEGTDTILAKSTSIHAATTGGKVTNPKSISVGVKKIYMKKGSSYTFKPTVTKKDANLKLKTHVKPRYESTNKAVAEVSKSGKLVARGAGSCTVYIYAQNGVYVKVPVVVAA